MTDTPLTRSPLSPAKREALADIATHTLYVGRDPGSPWYGSGYATATLRGLLQRGLITRGPYEPGKGHRLALTDAGRAALPTEKGPAETAPAADTALCDRIAALFRHPPGVERLGNATPGEIADAVLTALAPELAELADYRNRITWETTCGEHTRLLDSCRAAEERAERAAAARESAAQSAATLLAALTRVRELAEAALPYDDIPQDRLAQEILAALAPPAGQPEGDAQ